MLTRWLALFAGLVCAIAGAALMLAFPTMSFGWFAYAPLSDETFQPGPAPSATLVVGAVLLVSGFVLIAGWVGWRLGRRARP